MTSDIYSVLSVLRLLKIDFSLWPFKLLHRTHFFCVFFSALLSKNTLSISHEHFCHIFTREKYEILTRYPSLASIPLGDISISEVKGKQELKEWVKTQEVLESNYIKKAKLFLYIAINYICRVSRNKQQLNDIKFIFQREKKVDFFYTSTWHSPC